MNFIMYCDCRKPQKIKNSNCCGKCGGGLNGVDLW